MTSSAAKTVLVAHPSADQYGSDRMVYESVAGMIDAGHRVIVALPSDGPLAPQLRELGATVEFVGSPVLRKSAMSPKGMVSLAAEAVRAMPGGVKLMREHRVDVVYVSTLTVPLWIALARAARKRTIVHVHEAERHSPLVNKGMASPLLFAHALIINSAFSATVLTDSFAALGRKIQVIYNGVVGPAEVSPPREDVESGLWVVYLGRLSPRKGPQVAIAAVRSLIEDGQKVTLDVLGSVFPGYEWFEEELRRDNADLIEAGVVRLRGFTSIWPYLRDNDVAVIPSVLPEPFGNTAVEAVLACRPVVVSDIGGLPEAIKGVDSAQAVPADDALALAHALRRVAAEWTTWRARAIANTAPTAARFSPARYRQEIVNAL